MVYPVLTNEERTTESQRCNYFTKNGGNAIPKHAGPEAKGSNPTTGLTLLWAGNPFRGNFNHWQVSQKEPGQIFSLYMKHNSRWDVQNDRPVLPTGSQLSEVGIHFHPVICITYTVLVPCVSEYLLWSVHTRLFQASFLYLFVLNFIAVIMLFWRQTLRSYLTFRGPCIVIDSYNKTNEKN